MITTKHGTIPKRLYKYLNFEGLYKTLLSGTLKFTIHEEFNDVFE